MAGGGPGDAHDQPGVVDQLAVPVEMAEAQPVAPDPGHVLGDLRGTQEPGAGKRRGVGSGEPAQCGARDETQPGQDRVQDAGAPVDGHHLGQRADEVGRGAFEQDPSLEGGAARDADVAGGQVAQPSVGELGGPAAGAEGQVVGLEQDGVQAAGGGVEGDSDSGDAASDHHEVDGIRALAQGGELAVAPRGGQGGGVG